ncbi:MAG TPA: WD40 repeat domain-containing protein [Acidobacteriaceae bacterium]
MIRNSFRRWAALPLLTACFLPIFVSLAHAQGTRLWTESRFEDMERGTPNGVAIASDGHLIPGPDSKPILTTPSTYVWSEAADRDGNVYLATGTPATVLRVTPDGKSTTLFTSREMSVQVVRVGPDGDIYAATLPSGKVYRLSPHAHDLNDDNATVVFDPAGAKEKPKYVWDLAFDKEGRLYIATGGPGAIYRVTPGANAGTPSKVDLFFKSDEEHIRCIAFDKAGNLIAGSDGTGLIYRIDPSGKAFVLYDSPKKEITALLVSPDGNIYAAGVGEKGHNNLPPLAVTGQATVTATITIIQPGSVQAFSGNTLVPGGSELYEIPHGDGPPRRIWAGKDDILYALAWTPDGVLAATGNRGRIDRIHDDGTWADIAHLEASQVTGFADSPKGLYVSTANSGRLYLLSHGPAAEGTYTSEVFDAGMFSQWGRSEVELGAGTQPSAVQMFARAGNIENPERAWGDWKLFTPNTGAIGIPSSRFMQWKVVEHPGTRLGAVSINYLPVNMPPVVDEIVVVPGARANYNPQSPGQPQPVTINFPSTQANSVNYTPDPGKEPLSAFKDRNAVTVRWAAHDDNGDDLSFALYYRGAGEHNWQFLRDHLRERYLSFDASRLPDGLYRIKVVASDAPSHNPGEALTGDAISDDFVIDTTPPVVTNLQAGLVNGKIHASLTATDATSPVARAEYSIDAGRWQYIAPIGNIADSLTEHFDFDAPIPAPRPDAAPPVDPAEHVVAVRVFDRYDNVVTVKAVVHTSGSQ